MKHAFTLVETTIAITILVTALVGILALASYSYSVGGQSSETILSTSLAREGLEIIRAIRDSNWLALRSWDEGLNVGTYGTYIVNADSIVLTNTIPPNLTNINDCSNCRLCLTDDGRYVHCASPNTIYRRMLTVTNVSLNEKRISSEVLWRTKTGERTIKLQQILTNWR